MTDLKIITDQFRLISSTLGDEIRNMIMTIVVPLLLFVWFIGAFLWDGSAFRNNRNRYDTYKKEKTMDRSKIPAADTSVHKLD